jgi:hypothetical protein
MGVVVPIREDGRVTRRQPADALPLEACCDWGWCGRPGVAWRWSEEYRCWLVVCSRCVSKPVHEIAR